MKLIDYNWDNIADQLGLSVCYTTPTDICLMARDCDFHNKTQLNIYDKGKNLILTRTLPKMKHYGEIVYTTDKSLQWFELASKIQERLESEDGITGTKESEES